MYRDWVGIRPEHLTDANRAELEQDHGLAAVHRAELNLGLQLQGLPSTRRQLTLNDVSKYEAEMGPFVEGRSRDTWFFAAPIIIVCVAGLSLLILNNSGGRQPLAEGGFLSDEIASRSQSDIGDPRDVSISIEASQSSGVRALPLGATLHGFESAKLTVHVAGSGYLSVYDLDESAKVYPESSEPWFVIEGSLQLGDSSPLLFQRNPLSLTRNFLAALCEGPAVLVDLSAIRESFDNNGCVVWVSSVAWEARR